MQKLSSKPLSTKYIHCLSHHSLKCHLIHGNVMNCFRSADYWCYLRNNKAFSRCNFGRSFQFGTNEFHTLRMWENINCISGWKHHVFSFAPEEHSIIKVWDIFSKKVIKIFILEKIWEISKKWGTLQNSSKGYAAFGDN